MKPSLKPLFDAIPLIVACYWIAAGDLTAIQAGMVGLIGAFLTVLPFAVTMERRLKLQKARADDMRREMIICGLRNVVTATGVLTVTHLVNALLAERPELEGDMANIKKTIAMLAEVVAVETKTTDLAHPVD